MRKPRISTAALFSEKKEEGSFQNIAELVISLCRICGEKDRICYSVSSFVMVGVKKYEHQDEVIAGAPASP